MSYFEFPRAGGPAAEALAPRFARLAATATAMPPERVTNEAIIAAQGLELSPVAMHKIVGVQERRVAPAGLADSDLLVEAAQRCLARASLQPEDLSRIIVTKFMGDRALPMTASLVQKKLGCAEAIPAYDIDGGVHSFLHAVQAATSLIACGDGPVLVASGGVVNRVVSRGDPRVAFQYGDGAAALLWVPSEQPHLLASYSFSNSDYANDVVGFAIRQHIPDKIHENGTYAELLSLYEQTDWKPSEPFVLDAMAETASALFRSAGLGPSDVDLFLLTENHARLRAAIIRRLEIPEHKTLSVLERYGNTMSAMLPILLDEATASGRVRPGQIVMLLSLGEGITGGGALLRL